MNVLAEIMFSPEVLRRREIARQKVRADLADRIARARAVQQLDKVMHGITCKRRFDVVAAELRDLADLIEATPQVLMQEVA